jgi:hypothetical protein
MSQKTVTISRQNSDRDGFGDQTVDLIYHIPQEFCFLLRRTHVKPVTVRVGQIKLPKWAKCSCQTQPLPPETTGMHPYHACQGWLSSTPVLLLLDGQLVYHTLKECCLSTPSNSRFIRVFASTPGVQVSGKRKTVRCSGEGRGQNRHQGVIMLFSRLKIKLVGRQGSCAG